ncbi:MAG: hypothetical protein ACKOUR_03840, partial [Planctomycetota bacterium]
FGSTSPLTAAEVQYVGRSVAIICRDSKASCSKRYEFERRRIFCERRKLGNLGMNAPTETYCEDYEPIIRS